MARNPKVVMLPERQFLGALERALDELSSEVDRALVTVEARRHWRDQAREAQQALSRVRRASRRSHGVRRRRAT